MIKQVSGKLTLTAGKLTGMLDYTDGTVIRGAGVVVSAPNCCWKDNVLAKHKAAEGKHECAHCGEKASDHSYKDGYCTVCKIEKEGTAFVAEIVGGKKYLTLQAAIDDAKSGDTIELKRYVVSDALTISENITIKLNGYQLFFRGTAEKSVALTIAKGYTVTFENGMLCLTGTNTYKTLVENNGTLILNSVIVRGTGLSGENTVALKNNGTADINDASIVLAVDSKNVAIENNGDCDINIVPSDTVEARVSGVIKTVEGKLFIEGKHIGEIIYVD